MLAVMIEAMHGDIKAIAEQHGSIKGGIRKIKNEVIEVKSDVGEIKETLNNHGEMIGELKEDVGELKEDLKQKVDKDDFALLKAKVLAAR